jgi:hypothetical protein
MKSFKQFITESKESIDSSTKIPNLQPNLMVHKIVQLLCEKYGITNYKINPDGSVDVKGSVDFDFYIDQGFPVKFGKITGKFDCSDTKLTSLENGPQEVNGYYNCSNNKLTTLKGSPKTVGGDLYCTNNKLTSLVGCPDIGHDLYCENNKITDFIGVPEFFEGFFSCEGNPIFEIYNLFNTTKCIRWINEFDVIQGNKVIMDRLEEVFYQLEMDIPENIKFKHYEII